MGLAGGVSLHRIHRRSWLALWKWFVSRNLGVRQIRTATTTPPPRWSDRALWSFISAYALGALPMGFVLYEAANYLAQARGESQAFIGMVLWIPPLGWEVGYFFWGWLRIGPYARERHTVVAARR